MAFGEGIPASGDEVTSTMEHWRVSIGGIIASFDRLVSAEG
jgi:hypothetical protein